ncbi:MAG: epoxyqueuosine reductase QueH [Nitrospirae bacterium]|nr:epoxyqueuosine reductase QueH [Nitrospirota bacterium]
MKTLLHLCCANCSLYPVKTLRERGIEFSALWFNPNIHPLTEYIARLEAVKTLQSHWSLDVRYENRYGLVGFLRAVVNNEKDRCRHCYAMRLEETAKTARDGGFDSFSTTLLYSIYQNYGLIIETGKAMEQKYGVEFYVEDFRKGWHAGIAMSKAIGLYRQKYCGCIYSEMERFGKKGKDIKDIDVADS